MSANKNLWLATASAVVLFAAAPAFAQNTQPNVTIVQPDGPAEQAGEAVDNAAGNAATAAGNAANSAATAAGNAANTAATAAGNAANATANAAGNAANQASQAANNASEAAGDAANQAADAADEATDAAAETETAAAENQPVQGQIFEQSPDQYLASTLLDGVVMNAADEEIGDVNDMIVTKDGQVQGVVIGVGGFLGVGEKDVAIELSRVQITQDENNELNFMLDATADELANAPEFVTARDAEAEAEANSATTGAGGAGGAGMGTTAPAAPATAQ